MLPPRVKITLLVEAAMHGCCLLGFHLGDRGLLAKKSF